MKKLLNYDFEYVQDIDDILLKSKQIKFFNPDKKEKRGLKNPSTSEVRQYIEKLIVAVKKLGKSELTLISGEIHKELNMSSRYPTVCNAMRSLESNYKYEIIEEPKKGYGSRVTFRYMF